MIISYFSGKKFTFLYVASCLSILALYLLILDHYWTPEWDSAYLISVAKSLSEGKGLNYLGYPAIKLPPGFPFLLFIIISIFGNNIFIFKIAITLFAFLSFLSTYYLFTRFFSKKYSLMIATMLGFSFFMLTQSTYILTDVPFMAISIFSLYYIDKYVASDSGYYKSIISGLLIAVSYLIRVIGFAMLPAIIIYKIAKIKNKFILKKLGLLLVACIIPVMLWNIYIFFTKTNVENPIYQLTEFIPYHKEFLRANFENPDSGQINLASFAHAVVKNSLYYSGVSSTAIIGKHIELSVENLKKLSKMLLLLFILITLIIIYGFISSIKNKKTIFDFYFPVYLLFYLVISGRDSRYIVPILPFIINYFINGLRSITKFNIFRRKKFDAYLTGVFFLLFITSNSMTDLRMIKARHNQPFYSEVEQNFFNAIFWIKDNTPVRSRIVSVLAPEAALWAERWAISFPPVNDQAKILGFLKNQDIDFILISPGARNWQKFLAPVIHNNPFFFVQQFKSGDAFVYKVNKIELNKSFNKNIKRPLS